MFRELSIRLCGSQFKGLLVASLVLVRPISLGYKSENMEVTFGCPIITSECEVDCVAVQ